MFTKHYVMYINTIINKKVKAINEKSKLTDNKKNI